MGLQEFRACIHDVVWFEASENEERDFEAGLRWDIEATVDAVVDYLFDDGTYYEVTGLNEPWRQTELIHLCALDYFSSYEPVLVKLEVGSND